MATGAALATRNGRLHLARILPEEQPTVRGCNGSQQDEKEAKNSEDERERFVWHVEKGAPRNYRMVGKLLAARGDLNRHHSHGLALVQVLPDGKPRLLTKASHLAPVIVDRIKLVVKKDNKVVSDMLTAAHLNAMLRSEAFLGQFRPVDEVTTHPLYLDDFSLARPGYNDGGPGKRIIYVGPEPVIATSMETIKRFLDVMAFAADADRTNTMGAALTVILRRHWLGQKPVILVTSTKSHSGKGTITEFFRGSVPKADVLYESIDWPMQSQFQRQVQSNPDIGVVIFDNVRCDSAGRSHFIRSAFIESFVTNAEVTLASPGAGEAISLENRYVVTINTNDGKLSPDLMNRSLPIHLAPKGSIHERETPIGNPKWDYLPPHRGDIEAEMRGMIERWKAAGSPWDEQVKHSMTPWARTIGGILMVNGFKDFLGNAGIRKTADDPVQEALAILGVAALRTKKDGTRLTPAIRPAEWAKMIVDQGLAKTLLPPNERDTEKSRARATGVLLSRHLDEIFHGRTDTKLYHLRLEGGCRRWGKGKNPHKRYVFTIVGQEDLPKEDGPEGDEGTDGR